MPSAVAEALEARTLLATYVVNSLDDVASPPVGVTTLRSAITQANVNSSSDTIEFASGLTGTISLATGQLPEITGTLSIVGPGAAELAIDAHGTSRVLFVRSGTTRISGMTLTRGRSSRGGGINNFGTLTVADCVVSANLASGEGGGIYSDGTLTLVNSTLVNNSALADGGGIFSDGALTVTDSALRDNSATGGGGGIFSYDPLTVTNSIISDNSAANGGGISSSSPTTVINSTLAGNTATYWGGAIYGGVLSLTNCTLSGNSALSGGGAIRHHSSLSALNCTLSNNSAGQDGGGIYDNSGAMTLVGTTISGNSAARDGGGVFIASGGSYLTGVTATQVTIVQNRADADRDGVGAGGGIFNSLSDYAAVTLRNTIVADNRAGDVPYDINSPFVAANSSLIGVADVGFTFVSTSHNLTGHAAAPLEPMLGPLADNGGPTKTHAPIAGSRAINAGSDVLAVDPQGARLTWDQRGEGYSRTSGRRVDIGSVEFALPPVVIGSAFTFLTGQSVRFTFDVPVNFPNGVDAAFALENLTAGSNEAFRAVQTSPTSVTLSPIGRYFSDGNFRATAVAGNVVGSGGAMTSGGQFDFFFLNGDANRDGRVTLQDFNRLAEEFGKTARDFSQGNFDYDPGGNVSLADFNLLAAAFGVNLHPAADYVVNSLQDTANPPVGTTTLRSAIIRANSDPGADTITFDGSLTGAIQLAGAQLPTITRDLTIIGPGVAQLSIDGLGASRIFEIAAGATVRMSGLTLTRGRGISGAGGGAILNSGTLTVSDSLLSNNEANRGGGIYNAGALTLRDSDVANNRVRISLVGGGGIFNAVGGHLTVTGSDLSGNLTDDGGGGAVYNQGTADLTESTFNGNGTSSFGGAVYNDAELAVSDCTFVNNHSLGNGSSLGRGGAIYNAAPGALALAGSALWLNRTTYGSGGGFHNAGTATATESTFARNGVGDDGGAIYNSGPMVLYGSTVSANFADTAGGIFNKSADLSIVNATVSGNGAQGAGGGVVNNGGALTLTNSVIVLNRAAQYFTWYTGGGVYTNGGSTALRNTIVAGNRSGEASSNVPDDVGGALLLSTSAHHLIGHTATSGGLRNGVNGNIVGLNGLGVRPLDQILDPQLRDNGGPTLTHAPSAASPAINAGSNALAVDPYGVPLLWDQRSIGFTRVAGGTVDIGAIEAAPQSAVAAHSMAVSSVTIQPRHARRPGDASELPDAEAEDVPVSL